MKVFIEKYNDQFRNVNIYSAYYGFDCLGCEIEFFNGVTFLYDIACEVCKETPVVGSIRTVTQALKKFVPGFKKINDYPDELREFLDRDVYKTSFGELRKKNERVFAKPSICHKLFTGQVFDSFYNTQEIEDDFEVYACDKILNIQAEYRCFVFEKKLVYISNYTGDFTKLPDISVINNAIEQYVSQPIAYAIDFAVCDDKTILVEVNDCYSLGCYGLNPVTYAKMISARWQQLVS